MSERNPDYKPGDVIWRASNFGGREGTAVRYKPFCRHNHDNKHGGQIIGFTDDEITLKYHATPNCVGTITVDRSLKPALRKGDAVVLEIVDGTVIALHDGQLAGAGPSEQEASVDRGEFHASIIPRRFY